MLPVVGCQSHPQQQLTAAPAVFQRQHNSHPKEAMRSNTWEEGLSPRGWGRMEAVVVVVVEWGQTRDPSVEVLPRVTVVVREADQHRQ